MSVVFLKLIIVNDDLEYTCLRLVDAHLPEGVRVLSVFLSSDEYSDLVQRCSSSHVQQLESRSTQPVQHSDMVDSKSRTVGVGTSDSSSIGDNSCKQTDTEDCAEVAAGHDDSGPLIQQQTERAKTQDAAAVCESSAVSGEVSAEMCRPCNEVASTQTSDSIIAAGTSTTVTQASSADNDTTGSVADHVQSASDKSSALMPLELYIQGNSQTVFLLFMQRGCLSELDVVRDLVQIFSRT